MIDKQYENVGKSVLTLQDNLFDDPESATILAKLDQALTNESVKALMKEGIERLKKTGNVGVANQILHDNKQFLMGLEAVGS